MFHIEKLVEAAARNDAHVLADHRKKAARYGKKALKATKGFMPYRLDIYRNFAGFYWQINKQKEALKWFDITIKECERIGYRPNLARTYMDVGRDLIEPESKYKHLNLVTPEEYLEKARVPGNVPRLFKAGYCPWPRSSSVPSYSGTSVQAGRSAGV